MPRWPDADGALRAATLRLTTPAGSFAGTGFVVDAEGRVLTCHHVAGGHAELVATDVDGMRWSATPDGPDDPDLARFDLMILRITGGRDRMPAPVPLLLREPGDSFRSRAQHADEAAFRDAAPLSGALGGSMKIVYAAAGRQYSVEARPVSGVKVQQGMSGAPVWDVAAGAVVGLLAVKADDPNLGGFTIPLAQAGSVERLRALIASNDEQVARYGDRPNRPGLTALLAASTAETIERLKARGIVAAMAPIRREGFDRKLVEFLGTEKIALAIVSAAGQGKTNLLVQALEMQPDRPAWLVRCADLAPNEAPAAWLNRLLREADAPPGLVWPKMAEACSIPPLLLLDGLNEAHVKPQRLNDEWLPDLIAAAKPVGWRVVFTTRRELFNALPTAMREDSFALGRYTRGEARAAADAYGLRGHIPEREPLLLRIRAEFGGGARRSQVLDQFVRRLLQGPPLDAYGGHPETLMEELAKLAKRAAEATDGESGVASRTDPFFLDRPLAQALCTANLLETVPAGYRFVFDEVADYLFARGVVDQMLAAQGAGAITPGTQGLPRRANALALTLEILAERGRTELARQLADDLVGSLKSAQSSLDEYESFALFAALGALPDIEPFAAAKLAAIDWAVSDDVLIRTLLALPDVLTGFPAAAGGRIAKAAVLLEGGYGWREKDVYSEYHRGSTVSSARAEHGISRMILDLLDDDEADVGSMLIDWLSDGTRLSEDRRKFASHEATIGSFALCMLFAHRNRIGIRRLLEDVLKAERPGWESLLQALVVEETDIFMAWLEALDPLYAAGRIGWTLQLWQAALWLLRKQDDSRIPRRASEALSPLIPHLDAHGLGRLVSLVVGYNLTVPDRTALIRKTVEARTLEPYVLASAILRGDVDLEEMLASTGERGRDRLIWALVSNWTPKTSGPPLGKIVALLRTTEDWRAGLQDNRTIFEGLLYLPSLETAQSEGLCDAVDEQLGLPTAALRVMAYAAFPQRECAEDQAAFRVWLAEHLLPKLDPAELTGALGDIARMEPALYARYRDIGLRMARAAEADQLFSICSALNSPRIETLAELIAAWLQAMPRSGADADFLADLLARLTSPALRPQPEDLRDLTYKHLRRQRPARPRS